MTATGKYAALLERLPNDVAALVRIVQGLTLHEFVAYSLYGVALPEIARANPTFVGSNGCWIAFSPSTVTRWMLSVHRNDAWSAFADTS